MKQRLLHCRNVQPIKKNNDRSIKMHVTRKFEPFVKMFSDMLEIK